MLWMTCDGLLVISLRKYCKQENVVYDLPFWRCNTVEKVSDDWSGDDESYSIRAGKILEGNTNDLSVKEDRTTRVSTVDCSINLKGNEPCG